MKKLILLETAFLFAACASMASAQATNSGDIRGTVTDESGAVIPGVVVTVDDVSKDVTRTFKTDSAGLYDTGSIVPDQYILTFTKPGFKTYSQGPITLQVGLLGLNVNLTVGSTTQKVTVTANAPLLNTTSPELSTTLTSETMTQLPQVTPVANWQSFIILAPGTSGYQGGANNALNPGVSGVSANGSQPFSTALMDGATVSSPQSNDIAVPVVFDAISQVKISDSLFSAEYGTGGAIYNQISKGGTDQFHGEAYEYFQNNALNAAPYSFGTNAPVPILHYNEFGGNVGGPVLRRRMFFFFDYDKIVDNGGAANGFINVPSQAMRNGDFTGQNTIYDPTTQTIDANGVVHRQSFAQEYGNGNKIPAALIDSVAQAIQAYYPEPNVPGTLVNGIPTKNYFYNVPAPNPYSRYFGRIDYDITPSNRFTASEAWGDKGSVTLNEGICPIDCFTSYLENSNAQVSDVWSITPNLVNEARFGFDDELDFFVPYSLNENFPQKLGWQFAKDNLFPIINIIDEYGLTPGINAVYKEFVFDPSDIVTLIRGRHVLTFGGEFLVERLDSTPWGNLNPGTMGFTGVYTASTQGTQNTTGSAYADFLLGEARSWGASITPEYGGRLKVPQMFVQDDIKLRPNLTIDLGLRWMGLTGWHEVHGNERAFSKTIENPANNTLGAMWYAVTHVGGRTSLQAPIWTTLMPRVGVSWQPFKYTSVRSGFGVYTYPWSADNSGGGLGAAFATTGNEVDFTNGVDPVVLLNSDGNINYQGASGSSINSRYQQAPLAPNSFNGQGVGYEQYQRPVPILYQWNLAVQQQISPNTSFQIAYVGSHGANQGFTTDLNQVPESQLAPNDTQKGTNARPYTNFEGITGYIAEGISNYHSLQLTFEKRMSQGLQFNVNYTWAHFLDEQDTSGQGAYFGVQEFQNGYVPSANYGPSNFDIAEAVKGEAIYNIPIGKGRQFLNNSTLIDETIGGWILSTTVVAQTGSPFTVRMVNNISYSQAGEQYPNQVGNPHLANPSVNEWFNVAAFASPGPAAFGDVHRNSLVGPDLSDVDVALGKTFPIPLREGMSFEFQAEVQNLPNHPSFALPDPLIGPGHIGQITGVTVGGRSMQLVARFQF